MLEIANYADAAIILRTLAEATIVYKFYISKNDGEGLSRYKLRKTKRSIKDIMNDILPGYYDNVYASLCNFTHGDAIAQAIFRNISNKEPLKTHIAGINSKWFYYVSNQTISIVPVSYTHLEGKESLLDHAVYSIPDHVGIDEACIWGDYYFMEALSSLADEQSFVSFW